MNYRLDISYDGADYFGFQRQSKHITIQDTLEKTIRKVFGQAVNVAGSGRTDTKVHALCQTVSFKLDLDITADKLRYALNNALPQDITVLTAQKVNDEFHARFSAKSKKYIYKILKNSEPNPFVGRYVWLMRQNLDLEQMRQATAVIIGEHDFTSFCSTGSCEGSRIRTVFEAEWFLAADGRSLEFHISGNGFLYHMVRNLVGMLVQVGCGRMSTADFKHLLEGCNRTAKCILAPPQGLYLAKVYY